MAAGRQSERRKRERRVTAVEHQRALCEQVARAEQQRRSDKAFGAAIGAALLAGTIWGPIGAAIGGVAGAVLGSVDAIHSGSAKAPK